MIQRVQTIYLLLVVICMGLANAFTISYYDIGETVHTYTAQGFTIDGDNKTYFPLMLLFIPGALLALISIGLYKKRKLQLNLNKLNYLIILVSIALMFVDFNTIEGFTETKKASAYGAGFFLPLAALVFNFLANRGIKNDEKLISSLDRLR